MQAGDLVKTIYDPRWAVVTKAWRISLPYAQWAVQFVYPDGERSSQPERFIRDVIHVQRQD